VKFIEFDAGMGISPLGDYGVSVGINDLLTNYISKFYTNQQLFLMQIRKVIMKL